MYVFNDAVKFGETAIQLLLIIRCKIPGISNFLFGGISSVLVELTQAVSNLPPLNGSVNSHLC